MDGGCPVASGLHGQDDPPCGKATLGRAAATAWAIRQSMFSPNRPTGTVVDSSSGSISTGNAPMWSAIPGRCASAAQMHKAGTARTARPAAASTMNPDSAG